MAIGKLIDIFGAIVGVALAFVLVSNPGTAQIISAWGTAFSGSLRASMGK
jgi:hypothetical protein